MKTFPKYAVVSLLLASLAGCETGRTLVDSYESTRETPPVIDRHWDIQEANRKLLIVMVHGFDSTSSTAWGNFPKLITEQKDRDFANFNVVRYGYGSSICRNRVGIPDRGAGLKSFLKDELGKYDGAILVSHSMGGLVSMYALTSLAQEANKDLDRLPITVMTFGTPHLGLKAANILAKLALLCSDEQAEELQVFNKSSHERQTAWNSYFGTEGYIRYHYHVTIKTYYGESDFFVDRASACGPYPGCDEVDGNHAMMVKPFDTEHLAYKKLISVVRKLLASVSPPQAPTGLTVK